MLPSGKLTVRPWQIYRGWKTSEFPLKMGDVQGQQVNLLEGLTFVIFWGWSHMCHQKKASSDGKGWLDFRVPGPQGSDHVSYNGRGSPQSPSPLFWS